MFTLRLGSPGRGEKENKFENSGKGSCLGSPPFRHSPSLPLPPPAVPLSSHSHRKVFEVLLANGLGRTKIERKLASLDLSFSLLRQGKGRNTHTKKNKKNTPPQQIMLTTTPPRLPSHAPACEQTAVSPLFTLYLPYSVTLSDLIFRDQGS